MTSLFYFFSFLPSRITDFIFLIVFYMHGIIFFLMLQVESLFLLCKDFFYVADECFGHNDFRSYG